MDRPYVEWVRVENYRCIKSADLHLTPLHALIGPNDSGKSSLLRALQLGQGRRRDGKAIPGGSHHVLRLDPDELRRPVGLLTANDARWFRTEKGRGLSGLYDALLGDDRDAFIAIEQRFRELFPTAASLRLDSITNSEKRIGIRLVNGAAIGPEEMSEGMLYWLAFAILEHIAPHGALLIEEPENGLHPARIAEVVKILRVVSKRTQIILATHSPLVINELQPEEVTIVTRTAERGTICTPMKDTIDFTTREKIYALGELWLSFADGKLEGDLVPASAHEPIKE